jgi:hypothetical protein
MLDLNGCRKLDVSVMISELDLGGKMGAGLEIQSQFEYNANKVGNRRFP